MFRRMHPAARMADEWPLKVDSEREGSTSAIRILSFVQSCTLSFAIFGSASASRSSARKVASIGALTVVGK